MARDITDVFEAKGMEFHQNIRNAFLAIAEDEPNRCKVVSALQPVEDVLANALTAIDALGAQ
jgi:dTMP kinase